jgi:hypothetical protein
MVHLIFLAALAACHNPPSLFANHTAELDLGAGLYTQEQDHPDPPGKPPKLFSTISLNTSARWKDPSWVNPARASKFTSRSAIGVSPETTPSVLPFSSGKRVTSAMRKQRVIPPWTGGVFWYFGNLSNKEIDKLPMKPSLPPAPNIDSPVAGLSNKEITMMKLRSSGGKAAEMARELDKIHQMNIKNYQMQRQREEEEEKQQKDKEAAERVTDAQDDVPPDPLPTMEDTISNFSNEVHDIMNGVQDMETDDAVTDDTDDMCSPLKKCQGSSKTSFRRTANARQVSPTESGPAILPSARKATFLNNVVYPHS